MQGEPFEIVINFQIIHFSIALPGKAGYTVRVIFCKSRFGMKRICILLLLILLLVGCTANEEPLLIPPATEPPASTEAPLQTEAPTEPPDAGIASVQIVAPEALTVTAEDPSARFSVQFTQVDLTGALERGRLCTLRLSQDGKVLAEDLFLLNEGASADFCVDYAFERYMEQTSSLLTVSLLYQEEQLDAEIPEVMIENETDQVITEFAGYLEAQGGTLEKYLESTNQTPEQFRAQVRPDALHRVKMSLAVGKIALEEKVVVTDEEFRMAMRPTAAAYGITLDELLEKSNKDRLMQIKSSLLIKKTMYAVLSYADRKEISENE